MLLQIAGATGATGANALKHVAAGGGSEFAFAIVRMVRDMRSARGWQSARRVATVKPVRTGRLLMKITKVYILFNHEFQVKNLKFLEPRLARAFHFS